MAYIGREPQIGNFQVCDAISVVNGQASYTMQVSGVNATPQSANHMLVSLNGILQQPNSSFTISSSTITFASNLVTGDVIDFIQILGDVLDLGVPSDNTVSLAKLTATGTKDATTFLRGDNTFASAGITEVDMFRLTANVTSDGNITSNLERVDTNNFAKIGTGMSESSGVFSFPSTGLYEITVQSRVANTGIGSDDRVQMNIKISTDGGSNYTTIDGLEESVDGSGGGGTATFQQTNFINVTTSNFRVIFSASSLSSGSEITGNTTSTKTGFIFKRLGDSQ